MVGAVPAAALEHHLWGRENAPNSAMTLWAGNLCVVRLEGYLLFELRPALGAGKIVQRHGRLLLLGLDCNRPGFDLFGLRQGYGQDAVLEIGLGPVTLDIGWEHDTALE
jgi:hypothetical protein